MCYSPSFSSFHAKATKKELQIEHVSIYNSYMPLNDSENTMCLYYTIIVQKMQPFCKFFFLKCMKGKKW